MPPQGRARARGPARADLEKLARQWLRLADYAEAESGDCQEEWNYSAMSTPPESDDPHGPRH